MKWHAVIVAAGLAIAGLASPAFAIPAADLGGQIAARPGAIHLAATTKRIGGVSNSTGDITGDGTSDVVVRTPPKPKHKPVRRVRRHR